jgi:hypothetical protein
MKKFRAWYRKVLALPPQGGPSLGWAHMRSCIAGIPYDQALREENAWRDDVSARWRAGERI